MLQISLSPSFKCFLYFILIFSRSHCEVPPALTVSSSLHPTCSEIFMT